MSVNKRSQRGAAMVEMALTISLFLALVFAIIEFSLAYFAWARTNEAARAVVRAAIVDDVPGDLSTLSCPGGAPLEVRGDEAAASAYLTLAQHSAPFVRGDQLLLRYSCSTAGNPDRPAEMPIPEVTVEIGPVHYTFVVPTLLGMDATVTLPTASATRTGEDLYTEITAP